MMPLERLSPAEFESFIESHGRDPFDSDAVNDARRIIDDVRAHGIPALRRYATELDSLDHEAPLVLDRTELNRARESIATEDRQLLERTADRIREFAEAQRSCMSDLSMNVGHLEVGHLLIPVERAGCYAPGGRYPLPSSVLMTAVVARAAGVEKIFVATPSSDPIMLAAAAVAEADCVLHAGGAHAIAALAYGIDGLDPVDVIVGPGNAWVTAAKFLVSSRVRIDMLAGPSELLVIADDSADPSIVAADLLAQAEHDPRARPLLVATDDALLDMVNRELDRQLQNLATKQVAGESVASHGKAVHASDIDEAVALANLAAAEHVEIMTREADEVARRIRNAGAVFIGSRAAEVFGDYGVGPNHTLPTGGGARARGGLSVFDFLRVRTFIREARNVKRDHELITNDIVALARCERLEAHARAAERRQSP